MKKLLIFTSIAVVLIGCGGSGSGSSADETMVTAQLYTLKKGDKIVKIDANKTTFLKIHHTDGAKESVVELIEGNATIIRK